MSRFSRTFLAVFQCFFFLFFVTVPFQILNSKKPKISFFLSVKGTFVPEDQTGEVGGNQNTSLDSVLVSKQYQFVKEYCLVNTTCLNSVQVSERYRFVEKYRFQTYIQKLK